MDTIYALATARGRAGIAVVRLSGPQALKAVERLAGPLPPARRAGLRRLSWGGELLDEALVLRFAPGASFTGEAVCELHLHGGAAIIAAVFRAFAAMPGLRPADPGEFTRRAFENGRLDLAQVEGLADLVDAETDVQRRQALRVLSGAVGARVEGWRTGLVRAAALIEATIDFADEDVPVDVTSDVVALIDALLSDLRSEVAAGRGAERVRAGFEVAIVGRPNAGKSTLLNALAGRDAAITSAVAGTTRDVIEVRMDIAGLPVTLLDTAGLRAAADEVERVGIERTLARAAAADLRVFLLDREPLPAHVAVQADDIMVMGKADLGGGEVSGLTGIGLDDLIGRIGETLSARVRPDASITHARHRRAIEMAIGALESAREVVIAGGPAEIAADCLWQARRALEALVGRVDADALLGEIFARFCIGK